MRRSRAAVVLAVVLAARGVCGRAAEPLLDDAAAVGGLAASSDGRTILFIDASRRSIAALDGSDPRAGGGRPREVVSPPPGSGLPVAIGCLGGDVVAAVWRDGDAWDLRIHRVRPGAVADAARPEVRLPLGVSGGVAGHVGVAVSRSRDWLAVTGLPAPLPPVVRAACAGVGVRLLTSGEPPADDRRPVAAAVSPADELVLFEAAGDGAARLAFLAPTGRTLLRLDTGLKNVRAAAFTGGDGSLWAVAGRPAGLWRLDAEMRRGDQAVRPVPGSPGRMADPLGMVGGPGASLVVLDAGPPRRLLRIEASGEGDE